MEEHSFSNSSIALACEDVGVFLTSVGVEKREALRIKLTLEEILLEYGGLWQRLVLASCYVPLAIWCITK